MALKGNLSDFPVIQILNLVNLAQKTGSLIIQNNGIESMIAFQEGSLLYAQFGEEDNSLITVLYHAKKISRKQVQLMRERAGKMTDKQLGLLLINAGYQSQAEILNCLRDYYSDVVKKFFTLAEGSFHFEPETRAPAQKILVRIQLENLIIEGTRQMHEWEILQEEIPSLEMAVKFKDRPGVDIRNLQLSMQEWQVIKYVTPKNTIQQIARATKLNDLEIRRVIYTLLQAGIVEMTRPLNAPKVDFSTAMPNQTQKQQKSLVNRLISRLKSI
ncbi:MAG: DUF4388 domain-containing protein [Anaerolineaceae bacterium]|nr:DUF4388 domain-containing protein [Anaerolineaceae bacterium]